MCSEFVFLIFFSKRFICSYARGFGLVAPLLGSDSFFNKPNGLYGLLFYTIESLLGKWRGLTPKICWFLVYANFKLNKSSTSNRSKQLQARIFKMCQSWIKTSSLLTACCCSVAGVANALARWQNIQCMLIILESATLIHTHMRIICRIVFFILFCTV